VLLREQCRSEQRGDGPDDQRFRSDSSHSPSTQTSPSTKRSFFQMGTSFFSRSMPSRAASKAGLRWRRGGDDGHAYLSDFDTPHTVHHRDSADRQRGGDPLSMTAIILTAIGS